MNNDLWFNKAGSMPPTPVPGRSSGGGNSATRNNNGTTWTQRGITCYECLNGVAQGKSYIGLTSCPPGETTNQDPCNATSNLQDDCYDCTNQTMLRVARGTCLKGLTASPVDPVKNTSVNPCLATPIPVDGCMDPTATNYDSMATQDDGSCVFQAPDVLGCMDPTADNYDSLATTEDGSCTFAPVSGCMDPLADNYNALATQSDGSCTYPEDDELEEIDDEIKTAGLAGDNKMLMYIAIGIGVLILLKK